MIKTWLTGKWILHTIVVLPRVMAVATAYIQCILGVSIPQAITAACVTRQAMQHYIPGHHAHWRMQWWKDGKSLWEHSVRP